MATDFLRIQIQKLKDGLTSKKDKYLRIDLWIKSSFKYFNYTIGFTEKRRKVKRVFKNLREIRNRIIRLNPRYFYFLFQEEPHIYIRIGIEEEKFSECKKVVSDHIDGNIFDTFKFHIMEEEKDSEHQLFNKIMNIFTEYTFMRILDGKFKSYYHFSEEKIVHCLLNQLYNRWRYEFAFHSGRIEGLLSVLNYKPQSWKKARW